MEQTVKFELGETLQANFTQQRIDVTPLNTQIDYYRLKPEMFESGTSVSLHNISIPDKLEKSMLDFLTLDEKETVVFNIPVGKGKSTLFYGLVEEYQKQGFIVIMVSPYKKLVLKDSSKLREKGLNTFNYLDLDKMNSQSEEFKNAVACNVHVMTINCLLQNPGEANFMQTDIKDKYLRGIRERATSEGKGVVLFLDELHEGVFNFKNEFLPSLREWNGLIHKVFVASATFNIGAVKVLQLIAGLTDNKVRIVESPVIRNKKQAELHLHIVKDTYGRGKTKPLEYISSIIESNKGKRVNILSGSKSLVDSLTDEQKANNYTKKLNDPIVESILSLNPQITTSTEEQANFDINRNNIGTTFKTGIDINQPDTVFIILLPCIPMGNDLLQSEGNYGIFTDGVPSLIQAVGRLREQGEIHVFMYSPTELIDDEIVLQVLPIDLHAKQMPHLIQNKCDEVVKAKLAQKLNRTKDGKSVLELKSLISSIDVSEIESALKDVRTNNLSFGKYLSPYILWASLNNQFSNATLKSITVHKEMKKVVVLKSKDSLEAELMTHLNLTNLEEWKKCSLWECYLKVKKALEYTVEIDDKTLQQTVLKLSFWFEGKQLPSGRLKKAILRISELIRTNHFETELTYNKYIERVLTEELPTYPHEWTSLHKSYFYFNELGNEFKSFITQNLQPPAQYEKIFAEVSEGEEVTTMEAYVPTRLGYLPSNIQEFLSDAFVKRAYEQIRDLLKQDQILKEVFDPYQSLPVQFPEDVDKLKKLKNSVYKIFEDFYLVLGARTKKGKTNVYPVKEMRSFSLFNQEDINRLEGKA